MMTSTHYIISKRTLYRVLVLMAFLLTSVSIVLAQNLIQPDGRVNQVAHFGGDALYCVDRDLNPTNQYSDWGEGGFRLLNIDGQVLWFVPAEVIAAAVAEAKATGQGVLVATGDGTYGPTRIDTYVTADGDDYFVFSGYDEFGKPNSVEWKFCIPVGPIPNSSSSSDDPELQCVYVDIGDGFYELICAEDPYEYCEGDSDCLCDFGIDCQQCIP